MGKKKELNIEEIIRLYTQENYSANRLSKTFNVDVNTITNRLRSSGIEIKKHRKYLNGDVITSSGKTAIDVIKMALNEEKNQQLL